MLVRDLDLLDGDLVAIDGAFFQGDASKASIVTRKRLAEQLVAPERDIEPMVPLWRPTTRQRKPSS
jgi:hypothetical protein